MNNLTISTQYDTNATLISNTFIDRYMSQANGEFVKIYIYLLRSVSDCASGISISGMADTFNQTEADVIRALKYWCKNGIIALTLDKAANEITGITLCDLSRPAEFDTQEVNAMNSIKAASSNSSQPDSLNPVVQSASYAAAQPAASQVAPAAQTSADEPVIDYVAMSQAADADPVTIETSAINKEITTYTPAQINKLSHDDMEFQMLLRGINNYLGGSLSSTEISSVAYFYDSLKFPSDLIEYLIEYCAAKGHKKMRYIEKVALAWANAGITSVKDAKNETNTHNEITYAVMNAFGLTNRAPGQRERDYISKWTNKYNFDIDIIIEACNRTLKATHQPSFEYADSILTKWDNDNIRTLPDIMHADAKYELTRNAKKNTATYTKNNNKFNNFNQRSTNINDIESSLLSNNL